MSPYLSRVVSALDAFDLTLARFIAALGAPASAAVPADERAEMEKCAVRAGGGAAKLRRSFDLIEQTAVDIVDMQVRVRGETELLADALNALGKVVARLQEREEKEHVTLLPAAITDAVGPLDERAQLVAAAVFPSAIDGLQPVNRKLWDFNKILWKRYTDRLDALVREGKLTSEQQRRIGQVAGGIRDGFSRVNRLLNTLAEGAFVESAMVVQEVAAARDALKAHLQEARDRMTKAVDVFEPFVREAAGIADDVYDRLGTLRIPIFPSHGTLPFKDTVESAVYDTLSGVQRFALLNIVARMQATRVAGQPLWSPEEYAIRVTDVFPDRIYLQAKKSLIDRVGGDSTQFKPAPASLHRFREGSFKQKMFARANLQLCYQTQGDVVNLDADIDLFAATIPHLFGEVFVNHLTGKTTDQFTVRRILDGQAVPPVEGFSILTPRVEFA